MVWVVFFQAEDGIRDGRVTGVQTCALPISLVTDGRFSGGTHGYCVGHVAPEAVDGGPIAFVEDGDRIVIDASKHSLDLLVDAAELARRKADWKLPEPRYTSG